MKNNSRNRGFSLIELIVLIAMITVLSGLLIPQFMQYATSKRQTACKANRDALLNIYEKAVYDGQLGLSTTDLGMIVNASGSLLTAEYINQAKDYQICPTADEGGHYRAYVVDDEAYIVCDCHPDEVCSINLAGWGPDYEDPMEGEPTYEVPTDLPEPEAPAPVDAPEDLPVDTTETCNTGLWPYPMDADGRLDARWAAAGGAQPGAKVSITAPLHFIDKSGIEIVIVSGNTSATTYTISYEDAFSPLGKGVSALPNVIAASGKKYDADNNVLPVQITVGGGTKTVIVKEAYDETNRITDAAYGDLKGKEKNQYKKETLSKDEYDKLSRKEKNLYTEHGGKTKTYTCYVATIHHDAVTKEEKVPSEEKYRVGYGDMVTVNGVTYIYTKNDSAYGDLPKADATAYATDYDGWYRVPSLTTN